MTGEGEDRREDPATTDIHRLDDRTVERIAAGEVVERPASAVKELVENSIDADASRVAVEVDGDGTDRVRVRDDGVGMTEADVRAAVQEHTTSKIDGIDDLEAGVGTLGFRGEALHTIGAVSRMTIRTRPREDGDAVGAEAGAESAPDTGTELVYEGGEVVSVEPCGCPEGTTVLVEDLFYNTPARRKYLKSEATEFGRINRVVTQYALANPDVAVSLTHDGRETFATTGRGDLEETVLSVYGREVAEAMIPVEDAWDEGPVRSIRGLVSHPETNRASREYLSTFLDGRYVTASALREPVVEAYGGQLAGDRYPFAVLFLDVPGEAVDVNVHPRKMEARFEREDAVRRRIGEAVEEALIDHGLVRSSAPRGRSAPEQARIDPSTSGESPPVDDSREPDETSQADDFRESDDTPQADASPTAGDSPEPSADGATSDVTNADDRSTEAGTSPSPGGEAAAGSASTDSTAHDAGSRPPATDSESDDSATRETTQDGSGIQETARDDSTIQERQPSRSGAGSGTNTQTTLTGEDARPESDYDSLPALRVLGQYDDTYLVAESADGLVLIDQHAADERVNYERLQAALADRPSSQRLADPVSIELTAGEAAAFDAFADALGEVGFEAERVDDATVEVRSVPAAFDATLDPELLRDVLTEFVDGHADDRSRAVESAVDDLLADFACHPSITGNTSLTEGSVTRLLEALDDCENPYACPHGRPVLVRIDAGEIEDRFERDYPGH